MNLKRKKNLLLSTLVTTNVCLLAAIIFIGGIKTDFFKRVGERVGLIEMSPKDRSDYWCINGWTNTLEKLNIQCDIVFFGNSITRGSNLHECFPNVSICNLGYPGDNLDGMLLRVNQIKAVNPKKIFVMAGINGLKYQTDDVFAKKYETLIMNIRASIPSARIYIQSILPVDNNMSMGFVCNNEKILKSNEIIKSIACKHQCTYVDLHHLYVKENKMNTDLTRDGVHLLPESYDRWASVIEPYILE